MNPAPPPETDSPIEPISGDEARRILEAAMDARLGADWRDDESGWQMVTGHDFMARMTRGRVNVDFYVDLLGKVTVEEKPLNPAQESGRLIAWTLLILSLVIALLMARAIGWV